MTRKRAQLLIVVGAVGLLILGVIAVLSPDRGRFAPDSRLAAAPCAPSTPEGTVVHVTLSDGGVMMGTSTPMMVSLNASPDSVHAGVVTFIATNVGELTHELLILPAPRGVVGTRSVDATGKIDESSSLGEASRSCGQGTGPGISPGTSSWVTLHLSRGGYELLCDVAWHYASGMFSPFVVR
ncbi:MAG TPA: hypothetical protein VLS91_03235 [Acidimicrobiales bacterium]|nr:hypothetical protein [Acidimicrobiales bacterium]